jgi:hypothetical protein
MDSSHRLVLFAHARSGSSSLSKILQSHPKLHILDEPFNEGFTSWHPDAPNYLELITDIPSLEEQLERIFQSYNGIKVLDYQLAEPIYVHMLQRPDLKVLFLYRRNLLQSVVSGMLAEQSSIWHTWDMEHPIQDYYQRLAPLSISDIRKHIGWLQEYRTFYGQIIAALPEDQRLILVYEDVYLGTPEERASWLGRIWQFLNLDPVDSSAVQQYLDPHVAKMNSSETYQLIPNVDEINQQLGNDVTGWLF